MKQEIRLKLLFIALLSLFMISSAIAQTATVETVAISDDGEILTVHVDTKVVGCADEIVDLIVYFYDMDGEPLQDFNGKYCTEEGGVSTSNSTIPDKGVAYLKNFEVEIPFSELHLESGYAYDLQMLVKLYSNGEFIDVDPGFYPIEVEIL